jgi:hypothetical protein
MESISVPDKKRDGIVTFTRSKNGIEIVHSSDLRKLDTLPISEWLPIGNSIYSVSLERLGHSEYYYVRTMASSILREAYFTRTDATIVYNFFKKIFDNVDTIGSKLDTLIDVFTMGPIALKLGTAHPDLREAQERVNAALKTTEGGSRTYRKKYHKEKKGTIKKRRSIASRKN